MIGLNKHRLEHDIIGKISHSQIHVCDVAMEIFLKNIWFFQFWISHMDEYIKVP